MAPKTLGETIREARMPRYKLREFARLIEVSPTHLSDVENDRRAPSELLLSRIAKRLNLDLDMLMAAAGRMPEDTLRLLEKHPEAVSLFRKIATLRREDLKKLEKKAEDLARKKEKKG